MKVYYGANFWGHPPNAEELQPKKLNKEFVWGDISGFIPAIYTGQKGMAVDFCIRVSNDAMEAFYHKWKSKLGNQATSRLSEEEGLQIISENPLTKDFSVEVSVNGEKLESTFGCGTGYSSVLSILTGKSVEDSLERQLVKEYHCDEQSSWIFKRHICKWKKKPDFIKSLDIDLKPQHKEYLCEIVEIGKNDAGKKYELTHPATGQKFELHIHEVMCEEIDGDYLKEHSGGNSYLEYPTKYMALTYELVPGLPMEKFQIREAGSGERPKGINQNQSAEIILIGGADGPTSYFVAGKRKEQKGHFVVSAMYFTLPTSLQWLPVFVEKEGEEMRLRVEIE